MITRDALTVLKLQLSIDLFYNGSQINYSSVLMLIDLSSLATQQESLKRILFYFKMRAVGLTNTKECK